MSLPSGLIFFLDFVFSPNLGTTTEDARLGNVSNKSIYGTDQVGKQVTGGVDLLDARKGDLGGPRTVGARGYAYGSPTGSMSVTASSIQLSDFSLSGATLAEKKSIDFDPDLLSISSSGDTGWILRMDIPQSALESDLDYDNLAAISCSIEVLGGLVDRGLTSANTSQIRRATKITGSRGNNVQLYFISTRS